MTANYCANCGQPLKEYAIVCANCGMPVRGQEKVYENAEKMHTKERVPAEKVNTKGNSKTASKQEKSAFFALIFSFFIPGLGQVYNGKFWKGVGFMIGVPLGSLFLLVPGVLIWVWGMYDAYTESEKINTGELPYREATVWEIIGFLLLPFIVAFLLIVLIFIFIFSVAAISSAVYVI